MAESLSDLKRNFLTEVLALSPVDAAMLTNADLERLFYLSGGAAGPEGPEGPEGPQGIQGPAGADGADGFPTESQWNDLVARVDALENPA